MKLFKSKQIQPQNPIYPEPPKDDSITTLEIYARDRLKHEMYILNNFLESLYKEPTNQWDTNYSKNERWVACCNNHIKYVQDVLNYNYGNGAIKKCKYCDSVFNGYMAGAKLDYHNNIMHKQEIEKECTISMACIGLFMIAVANAIDKNLPAVNPNASDKV